MFRKFTLAVAIAAAMMFSPGAFAGHGHGGHGHGRWWRGRWYGYGVGACWAWTPYGYRWICY
jgi:hypothetical protein